MGRLRFWRALAGRMSIRWRLALASFGLLAVVLVALGTFVSLTEEHALLANQASTLRSEAQLVASASSRGQGGPGGHGDSALQVLAPLTTPPPLSTLSPGGAASAANLVQRLTGADLLATVLAPDGTLIASSDDQTLTPPFVEVDSATLQSALTSSEAADAYTLVDAGGAQQLVVLLPLVSDQNTVALLQLSTPTAPIEASLATTRLILLLGSLGALIVAAALTLPLVRAALRPLVAMERASRHIADGALSLRLEVPPAYDEIGRLTRSFNTMVARLEAAFQRQEQFVADVSHELRTPLTALGGGLEMLLLGADNGDAEASRRLVQGMYAEVGRMHRLVEDLLTLTRLDERRTLFRWAQVDVGALVEEVCEQAHQLASGQEVRCEAAPGLPNIEADADRLKQVLLILVDNALKFTPAPGQVMLAARQESSTLLLEVRDTGEGIPPEALPHVFERFYRADPARARSAHRAGGSGLGLSIAQGFIEAHGGQVWLASQPGAGTTVSLRLPIRRPAVLRAGDMLSV
jgi:two-component system OmpR family sensor kinase